MTLYVRKLTPDESWEDCVKRYAAPYGLETECMSLFECFVQGGQDKGRAAFDALYEWDLLDFRDDDAPRPPA